jgi:hypothetical protein
VALPKNRSETTGYGKIPGLCALKRKSHFLGVAILSSTSHAEGLGGGWGTRGGKAVHEKFGHKSA